MKYTAVLILGPVLGWIASAELDRYQVQGKTRLDTQAGDAAVWNAEGHEWEPPGVRRETVRAIVQRRFRARSWNSWVRREVGSWWAVAVWAALPALLGYVVIPGGATRTERRAAPRDASAT